MAQYLEEERHMREENLRLQRKLQREMERREALCRQLSESESSLEMDDERFATHTPPYVRAHTVTTLVPGTQCPLLASPQAHTRHGCGVQACLQPKHLYSYIDFKIT